VLEYFTKFFIALSSTLKCFM